MARPIKETPVLKGKDAIRFKEKMASTKPITDKEREKAEKIYEEFKSIAKFPL